jgi:diaminohydroxyphosphoribosylaminopyrimidine deaminase/5-amino-6-(5-phosphoribosylamino)uracil reductase
MPGFSALDHAMMARALRLAERGAYTTKPNPMVGCVIVRDGEVVGEGFHERAGGPHAEVVALEGARERAKGATAYVTLEPCSHTGQTGPCADALIAAGVARVVGAIRDPNPQVDGSGFERLVAAGIQVETGLMEAQARTLNRGFLSRIERGRPWLRVKLATSLDGRSALASGDSKWISGEPARMDVQRWRARSGALLTGAGTVLVDDPHRCAWCSIRAWRPSRVATSAKATRRRYTCTRWMHACREGSMPSMHTFRSMPACSISTRC